VEERGKPGGYRLGEKGSRVGTSLSMVELTCETAQNKERRGVKKGTVHLTPKEKEKKRGIRKNFGKNPWERCGTPREKKF